MSGPEFFTTKMGRIFFDSTMPKLVDELARLNATLTVVASELRASNERAHPAAESVHPTAGSARPPAAPAHSADTAMPRKATLAQIAQQHLQIDTLEQRGSDSLDFHEVGVASLESALRAAYQAGIVAGLWQAGTTAPVRAHDGADEPR